MKRALLLLLLLVPGGLIACGEDEPTGPSEGPGEEMRSVRPSGPPPGARTVSGRKFHDLDADGTNDGGSDPGLSGWRIDAYTDSDRDGVLDVSEFVAGAAASAVTDANGDYTLMLAPGRYIVCEALQAGWTQSHPVVAIVCAAGAGLGASGYGVTVAHGTTDAGNDFGNF